MKNLFKCWSNDTDPINIPTFYRIVQSIIFNRPLPYCHFSPGCMLTKHYLSVDWDGSISICNRTSSLDNNFFKLADLSKINTLEKAFEAPVISLLNNRVSKLKKECSSCFLFSKNLCQGGSCPFLAYVSGNIMAHPPNCKYESQLIKWVWPQVVKYKKLALNILKEGDSYDKEDPSRKSDFSWNSVR